MIIGGFKLFFFLALPRGSANMLAVSLLFHLLEFKIDLDF